jgi:hypothetical protein
VNIQSLEKTDLFRRVRGFTGRLADKRDGEKNNEKGPKMHSSDYWHPKRQDSRELFVRSVRWIQLAGEVGG